MTNTLGKAAAKMILSCLAALLCSAYSWANTSDLQLPDLGSPNRAIFSQQQEDILSLAFLEALYQQADLISDPELNQYIRTIGQRLLRHVSTSRQFQFYLINDNSINAFAGPGGIIALNTGLIQAAHNEDEIAAVMAHEIQHVQQEHLSRLFANNKKTMLATMGSILGAILVGSQNPQAAAGILMGGMAYNAQEQLTFSRDNEWEADRTGIDILAAAGYNPNAMADFFETLANRYRNDEQVPEMLLTHPITSKRLSDSRAKARTLSYQQRQQDDTLALAKIRIAILQGKQADLTSLTPQQACYLTYATHALQHKPLPANTTNCILPKHLWSDLAKHSVQPNLTTPTWQSLQELNPNNYALLITYADDLLQRQQSTQVIELLTPSSQQLNEGWEIWRRIAQAWNQQRNEAQEAYSMAKAYSSIGWLTLAHTQIKRAERHNTQAENIVLKQAIETLKIWIETQQKARASL